jgi:hypothetical protein
MKIRTRIETLERAAGGVVCAHDFGFHVVHVHDGEAAPAEHPAPVACTRCGRLGAPTRIIVEHVKKPTHVF